MQELLASIQRNAIGLGLFAIVTAGAIAVAQVGTADRIAHNMRLAQSQALNEIVPANQYDNDLLADVIPVDERFNQQLLGPLPDDATIHLARRHGQVDTVILPVVAPDGYTMEIGLLVGIHADGSIAGVRVISHRETPGLGDKIDLKKSRWVMEFNGKSLASPGENAWAVKKDGGSFDQFTGATITPRAVVAAVKHALRFFEQHKTQLLSYPLAAPASHVENN
ncbi:electron transport complex subunit RsxG [Candidatus Thalassolituus haligoni]|uniref:electron transport complex subunit RsxG n=1 Tax=Candidatus Thalassolituus haligoni TaxID=3100113 RepID=UPI003516D133|tara:strand:+ start:4509 stop:5177 length:669 start_codon:yes stop_codon:yes gene_type:complete